MVCFVLLYSSIKYSSIKYSFIKYSSIKVMLSSSTNASREVSTHCRPQKPQNQKCDRSHLNLAKINADNLILVTQLACPTSCRIE